MGLDASSHAIDVDLIQGRLIPHLLNGAPVDDLIERAIRNKLASTRANAWAGAVLDVSHKLFDASYHREERPVKPAGLLSKIFGKPARPERPRPVRLPGFDSDLHVWGRPFFIEAATPGDAARELDAWLQAAEQGEAAVDALARLTLSALERKRVQALTQESEERAAFLKALVPLDQLEPAPPGTDDVILDATALRLNLVRALDAMRAIVHAPDPQAIHVKTDYGHEFTAHELQARRPYDLVDFAAAILPGWMSRGNGYASNVFDMIGVKDEIFETPEALFAPLGSRCPNFAGQLHATIPENYALGGYVPPHRVARFIEILDARREDYVLAFDNDGSKKPSKRPAAEIDEMDTDWRKVRETAEYAKRHGYAYLEGAEIYSGFLGQMN